MATHPGGLHRLLPASGAVPVDLRAHLDRYGALSEVGRTADGLPGLRVPDAFVFDGGLAGAGR